MNAPDRGDDHDSNCVFCRVIEGGVAADLVWRDDETVGFLDRSPLFVGHTLVVPRRHVVSMPDLRAEEVGPLYERVRQLASVMPGALGAQGTFVATNNIVSQSVPHLHIHVVPRSRGDGLRGFFWPRTKYAEGESAATAARLAAAMSGPAG